MNRKVAKLIRGFTKLTNKPFREFKRAYDAMSGEERHKTKVQLQKFWVENEETKLLDHKKYYDLKKPLSKDAAYTAMLRNSVKTASV